MGILKIKSEERFLAKFEDIKELTLLKILNMMGVKENLLLWFTSFLTKSLKVAVLLIMRLNKIYN